MTVQLGAAGDQIPLHQFKSCARYHSHSPPGTQVDDFETLSFSAAERAMEVLVGATSRFFAGHFPGRPLLPAIAHLVLVDELVKRCLGEQTGLVAVQRARWKRPVLPGTRLRVRLLEAGDSSSLRFEIDGDGERVSEGLLAWGASGTE